MAASLRSTCRFQRLLSQIQMFTDRQIRKHYMTGSRNILQLHERGIFQNVFPETRTPELLNVLKGSPQCIYCGFDPTADSLHIGNLLAIMAMLHCQRGGHSVLAVLGGATAQIGDPSGKTKERPAMNLDTIQYNVNSLQQSLQRIFNNHAEYFAKNTKPFKPLKVFDNREWYARRNVVEFMSTVGRHFRMGQLLGRHSVESRLKSAEGMSLTEFTYQVFQSYDWLHLYQQYNCLVQIGGNDQMGNIVAGHDLISRITNKPVFGLTVPLVTTTTGDKLGKTAGNAVWLNREKTSPFDFYQFFVQRPDSEVEKYLNFFTFLPDAEIRSLMKDHKRIPEMRKPQKKLAEEVTRLVHGEAGLSLAQRCTDVLYHSSANALVELSETELAELFNNASSHEVLLHPGTTVMDAVMAAKCFGRKVDADRIIKQGGVWINQRRITQPDYVLIPGEHILPKTNITLIRVGKKNYSMIKWLA